MSEKSDIGLGWNYRVVYHPPSKYKGGETWFDREEYVAIHEVYYDDDGNPNMMTLDAIVEGDEGAESLASLKWILENQLKALDKPVLEYELKNEIYDEISQEKQNEFSKSDEDKKQSNSEDL